MEVNNPDYTILIVDDVDANVLLLKLLISKAGYKTMTAFNGRDALDAVEKQRPDLILLDIMMPIMDGHEVARKLKEKPEYADIPIIFLSALNSTEDIIQGFRFGAADYVSKPFNKDELLTRINHQISLIEAKRIITRQTEELRRTILGRDKLYSVIAHDLRAPIASIRMVMEVLISEVKKESIGDDMFELLTMANRLTDDSFSLLDNLLKWTKSQTGRLNTVFQDNVDLMNMITGVVEVQRGVASLKNVRLNLIGSTNRTARIDIDMAKTSLRNLISNAIKFSYENSEIDVGIEEQQAGCNQALVHYYFRTKENLFNKLFEEKFLMFIESISIDEECKGGLKERIENIVTKHVDFLCNNPGLPLLLLSEVNRNSDHIGHIFEKMKIHAVHIVTMLEAEIAKERGKGLVRDVNGFDLIFNIISLNVFMFIAKPLLMNIREMSDESYIAFINARKDEIIKTIIGGIYL